MLQTLATTATTADPASQGAAIASTARNPSAHTAALPAIPVSDVGPDFALDTLAADGARAQALFDEATRGVPRAALKLGDKVSRRWLEKWDNEHLREIDEVAARMGRPGTYFLSVNYEWGCTTTAKPCPEHRSARLIRVLDWRTPGLGRHIMAARVRPRSGSGHDGFVTFTWPGYTGVLQAMAPGRFSAALNQAPMRKAVGLMPLDWAANRARVWSMPHMTPAHLLRQVFETASDFDGARRMLMETPISTPAIFTLAGLTPVETCIIERQETIARELPAGASAGNHFQSDGWDGRPRGRDSEGRAARMCEVAADMDVGSPWLAAPILNERTRLVMMADASQGRVIAQGFEDGRAATQPLSYNV